MLSSQSRTSGFEQIVASTAIYFRRSLARGSSTMAEPEDLPNNSAALVDLPVPLCLKNLTSTANMMLSSVFSSWLLSAALYGRAIASTQGCPQPTVTPSCTEEYFRSQGALPCQFNATIERVQPVQNGNFG